MKILVVEDNPNLARFVTKALAEEGHATVLVTDGAAALAHAKAISYDLIVLDWMLPEVDGLQVCRELRQKGSRIPILMLTARADAAERIVGLDAGADDYVTKPFDLGEFLARIRALDRRARWGETVLRTGPLTIDANERSAYMAGRDLELTPREFALLACLARNAGCVVSQTALLAKAWQTGRDPEANVVEPHIRSLREKLAEFAPMVETVPGEGYRLSTIRTPR